MIPNSPTLIPIGQQFWLWVCTQHHIEFVWTDHAVRRARLRCINRKIITHTIRSGDVLQVWKETCNRYLISMSIGRGRRVDVWIQYIPESHTFRIITLIQCKLQSRGFVNMKKNVNRRAYTRKYKRKNK